MIKYVYGSRSLESITLLIPWASHSQPRFSRFFACGGFAGRNRTRISLDETRGERGEDSRVSPAGYAVRFGRNERGGGGGAFGTTGPPTLLVPLFPSSSASSSAALLSVGRAFPRTSRRRFPRARLLLTHIPLRPTFGSFSFLFLRRVCIYERGYPQYLDAIDSIFVEYRDQYFHIYIY